MNTIIWVLVDEAQLDSGLLIENYDNAKYQETLILPCKCLLCMRNSV